MIILCKKQSNMSNIRPKLIMDSLKCTGSVTISQLKATREEAITLVLSIYHYLSVLAENTQTAVDRTSVDRASVCHLCHGVGIGCTEARMPSWSRANPDGHAIRHSAEVCRCSGSGWNGISQTRRCHPAIYSSVKRPA